MDLGGRRGDERFASQPSWTGRRPGSRRCAGWQSSGRVVEAQEYEIVARTAGALLQGNHQLAIGRHRRQELIVLAEGKAPDSANAVCALGVQVGIAVACRDEQKAFVA